MYALMPFPADELQMRRYAQHLSEKVKSIGTINNYVSAVKTFHQLVSEKPPNMKQYLVTRTLKGLKTVMARPVRQAAPITPKLLYKMYEFVNFKDQQQMVAWVAILYGFHMLLRKSNLVPDSVFDPSRQLSRGSLCLSHKALLVEIVWSKTLQFKERKLIIPVLPVADNRICAYYWTLVMINSIPAGPLDPALCYYRGQKISPLTYSQLTKWLKLWVESAGESPVAYSSHSMRRGGATFAYESDMPGRMIQVLGDWASLAYLSYIDQSLESRLDSMAAFAEAISKV